MEEKLMVPAPAGVLLSGVLHRPSRPAGGGAVICHGMMSAKDSPKHHEIAALLARRGHLALRFDFSGRGESPGDLLELTFTRQVGECRAAVAALRRAGAGRVALVGSSMGGAVAILAAPNEPLAALATMAALGRASLLPERAVGKTGLEKWRRQGSILVQGQPVGFALVEDARRIDILAAAQKIACPWLILHGERDETIPPRDAELLHQAAPGSLLQIVAGADHRFSTRRHRRLITTRIVDFLDAHLGEQSGY